MMIYSEIE